MNQQLSVAVPWSLSHYIPLNGFHPLYRALFETKPDWVQLSAWDNIELSQKLHGDDSFRRELLREVNYDLEALKSCADSQVKKEYFAHFWTSNRTLTRLLPGDIEFHHTAPFPSLERPFVFHCESFAPVFFPFAHQGTGSLNARELLREHYGAIFAHPLCLGIFSHLPQTLEDFGRFFASPTIDAKLFSSRIGWHGSDSRSLHPDKEPLSAPLFLFVNSAHQNSGSFFLRGGHIVLRFWQRAYPEPRVGRLIMRCARPTDAMLREHGVDLDWLHRHERCSVIWIEDYLSAAELDALMQAAHFFLLPSVSLHSVSIMQAMAAGAVPVVSDTIGTNRYVLDGVDGIMLSGVLANNWHRDKDTGVMIDLYARNPDLETGLVQQLNARISDLMAQPAKYYELQARAGAKAREEFSGQGFSEDFWQQVRRQYLALPGAAYSHGPARGEPKRQEVAHCMLEKTDWPRIFTSPPQPVARLHAGQGRVIELGGCFIALPGACFVGLHDWSAIAEYVCDRAPSLIFSADIKGLGGRYLGGPISAPDGSATRRVIAFVAERLMPYPRLYTAAAGSLKLLRKLRRAVTRHLPAKSRASLSLEGFPVEGDIELVMEGVQGLNIIRCGHFFYAIPQGGGEFSQVRVAAGNYDLCISGTSLKDVLRKIEELPALPPVPDKS